MSYQIFFRSQHLTVCFFRIGRYLAGIVFRITVSLWREKMDQYGFISILPPVAAIVLAFVTRQVLFSLFVSIWFGVSIMHGGNPLAGLASTIQDYIAGSIARPWNASIITYSLTLGGMIGILTKSGGIRAVADLVASRARTAKSGQLAATFMGLAVFFDDYANTVIVGGTMRPLTDRLRISHEKLSYICDSTAAPVASIAIISTWAGFEIGLIKSAFETLGLAMNTYGAFVRSIPYRFYSFTALFAVFAVILLGRDFGPMLSAERRARRTGKVIADGARPLATGELTEMPVKEGTPLRWYNAFIPLLMVVLTVAAGLYITGYRALAESGDSRIAGIIHGAPFSLAAIREVVGSSNAAVAMMWGAFAGAITAVALVTIQRILTLREAVEAWVDGAKSFVVAIMILVLAWGIGSLSKDMGTASYLVSILRGSVRPEFIPVAVFLIGCLISFATGTAYGTSAILMPIAVPLCYHLTGGETGGLFFATMGAVFTGAVFGDHCSPLSDTTIMSSMACASDHIDHVRTQMPYAVAAAVIAVLAGFIPAALSVNPAVSILIALGCMVLVVRFAGKKVETV